MDSHAKAYQERANKVGDGVELLEVAVFITAHMHDVAAPMRLVVVGFFSPDSNNE